MSDFETRPANGMRPRYLGQRGRSGCVEWLGIRYAKPPVGELRWRPPQPVPDWRGIRQVVRFGPACPQAMGLFRQTSPPSHDEDCLFLNIWSPSVTGLKPVLVWFHGGAFVAGSANPYHGAHLAMAGGIVVVTVNYRLGILGFVNFGSLPGGERFESNLGLRDQVTALRWVQENISAFGGDPDRVTIAGESAGSIAVALLMLAPSAWPYFHGAIIQSGAANLAHDQETSRYVASLYAEELRLTSNLDERLRSLDVKTLIQAQQRVAKRISGTLPASPWFDGDLLPRSFEAAQTARTPRIPLLAGYNRDEIRLFELLPGPKPIPLKRGIHAELLRRQLGAGRASEILSHYPETKAGQRSLGADVTFRLPTIQFALRHMERRRTWLYRFDAANPLLGATHALDLLYLWEIPGKLADLARGGSLTGNRLALANRMRAQWTRFVREGYPDPDWPRLDSSQVATKLFTIGEGDPIACDPEQPRRSAWNGQMILPARQALAT